MVMQLFFTSSLKMASKNVPCENRPFKKKNTPFFFLICIILLRLIDFELISKIYSNRIESMIKISFLN